MEAGRKGKMHPDCESEGRQKVVSHGMMRMCSMVAKRSSVLLLAVQFIQVLHSTS